MFDKVLVANRGAIACRIFRTLRRMGIGGVAVYSEADRHSRHVAEADAALCIGPPPVAQSYLDVDRIVAACREAGAQAVHPGYGFLSENAGFAERLAGEGIAFIGPRPAHMRAFGLKHTARELAARAGVPLLPGSGLLDGLDHARAEAAGIGYPLMIRARRAAAASASSSVAARTNWRRSSSPCSALAAATSRTAASSWKNSSPAPATSRCRSSATARAA